MDFGGASSSLNGASGSQITGSSSSLPVTCIKVVRCPSPPPWGTATTEKQNTDRLLLP